MTMIAIEERLKEKAIHVELRATGLAFIPKSNLDDDLREELATAGRILYNVALDIRARLKALRVEAEGNPADWKAIHKRITAGWPWDTPYHFDAYGQLVSWVGALLMRTTAMHALTRSLTDAERGGRQADISFTDRLVPGTAQRLVSTCILWPSIRKRVMGLKVGGKETKQNAPA